MPHTEDGREPQKKTGLAGSKGGGRSRYFLREWQLYALMTLIGIVIAISSFLFGNQYLAFGGIAFAVFSVFGMIYGLIKERDPA